MHSFFFLAEGGIRAGHVTGVQTCALPIWSAPGSVEAVRAGRRAVRPTAAGWRGRSQLGPLGLQGAAGAHGAAAAVGVHAGGDLRPGDRKSTRLNSSHVAISYAVFCLKKKK